MNKIYILTLLFILCIPSTGFAISGACSSHGGVNCDAGPDWDLSVICNDGWRESDVKYGEADECSKSVRCPYPINNCFQPYPGCTEAELVAIRTRIGQSAGFNFSSQNQQLINNCQNKIEQYNRDIDNYNICLSDYQNKKDRYNQCINDWTIQRQDFVQILTNYYNEIERCSKLSNSYIKNGLCVCNDGYDLINNQCQKKDSDCKKVDLDGLSLFTINGKYYYDFECKILRDAGLESEIKKGYQDKCKEYKNNILLIYNIKIGSINKDKWLGDLENECNSNIKKTEIITEKPQITNIKLNNQEKEETTITSINDDIVDISIANTSTPINQKNSNQEKEGNQIKRPFFIVNVIQSIRNVFKKIFFWK